MNNILNIHKDNIKKDMNKDNLITNRDNKRVIKVNISNNHTTLIETIIIEITNTNHNSNIIKKLSTLILIKKVVKFIKIKIITPKNISNKKSRNMMLINGLKKKIMM